MFAYRSLFILLPCFDAGSLLEVKTSTDFDKILTFSLARRFDFVLSLGVTAPIITTVMGIS